MEAGMAQFDTTVAYKVGYKKLLDTARLIKATSPKEYKTAYKMVKEQQEFLKDIIGSDGLTEPEPPDEDED
jgi:hypothetical protein